MHETICRAAGKTPSDLLPPRNSDWPIGLKLKARSQRYIRRPVQHKSRRPDTDVEPSALAPDARDQYFGLLNRQASTRPAFPVQQAWARRRHLADVAPQVV